MSRRTNAQEMALTVVCPMCGATKNRRCVRMVNPHRGGPIHHCHRPRIEAYLEYERANNPPLSAVQLKDLKPAHIVRCQSTGRFGKISHVHRAKEESIAVIMWDNGFESRHLLSTSDAILLWKDRLPLL